MLNNKRTKGFFLVFLLILIGIFTPSLSAQEKSGSVSIYIFAENGMPLSDIVIKVDDKEYTSNADGMIFFKYRAGKHRFILYKADKAVAVLEIEIKADSEAEQIITVPDNPQINLEEFQQGTGEENTGQGTTVNETEESKAIGFLKGKIRAASNKEAIAGVTIIFRGQDVEAVSNEKGEYTVKIPIGKYSVSFIHPDYSTQTKNNVPIEDGKATELDISLTPSAFQMEEIPVSASDEALDQGGIANLIEETKNSGAVLNLIGSEQIGRTGDSNAAGALRRVTGLTLVDGKYVYVRGMGERYSSSLLNGARLPSPEPGRRVVPLDLFPASILESISVQKTFTPDLWAEFGGGVVSIRTTGIPDDRYRRRLKMAFSSSFGLNTSSTFKTGLVENGGKMDWLGFDDGFRNIPREIVNETRDIIPEDKLGISGMPREELELLGETMTDNWMPVSKKMPLDFGFSGSVSDKIELTEDMSMGISSSMRYSNKWDYSERVQTSYNEDQTSPTGMIKQTDYFVKKTENNIDLSSLLDINLNKAKTFFLSSTTIFLHATDGIVKDLAGLYRDDEVDLRQTEQNWVEQTLFSESVKGTFTLPLLNDAKLKSRYTFSLADRQEPDRRYVTYWDEVFNNGYDEEQGYLAPRSYSAGRMWTNVQDMVHDGSLSLSLPFMMKGNGPNFMDFGTSLMYQKKSSSTRRFKFFYDKGREEELKDVLQLTPEQVLSEDYIGWDTAEGEFISFDEYTEDTDNYYAKQLLWGSFLSTDLVLPKDIRLLLGCRFEYFDQSITTVAVDGKETSYELAKGIKDMFHPALNITFPLPRDMQIRVGGSGAVNRPDLREISPAPDFGAPGEGVFKGNPDVQTARIWNIDSRWEWYITKTENISLGGFYKFFQNPIEMIVNPGAEGSRTLINIPLAHNIGGEFEWMLSFNFLANLVRKATLSKETLSIEKALRKRRAAHFFASVLRDLSVSGNISVIWSQIDYVNEANQGDNTSSKRPLQGQAPYIVNVSFGYKNTHSFSSKIPLFTSIFFNYNVVGPRISAIGKDNVDDLYLQPFHNLNMVFEQQIGKNFVLGAEIGNILDLYSIETVGRNGTELVEKYKKGRSFSLSAKLKY